MVASMPEACVFLIAFMRRAINEVIFDIFVRSTNVAHKRKMFSIYFLLFTFIEIL